MKAISDALSKIAAAMRTRPADDVVQVARAAGLRLLPIRPVRRDWWRQNHGPLLARDNQSGNWVPLAPRSGSLIPQPAESAAKRLDKIGASRFTGPLFLAYPRWPDGPATLEQWLRRAAPEHGEGIVGWLLLLAAGLPRIAPAMTLLLLGSAGFTRPSLFFTMLSCVILGGVFAGWGVALLRLRDGRDTNLRLHGLLWDRLITPAPWSADYGRDLTDAAFASRLRDGLSAAARQLETPDRLRERGIALTVATAVMAWVAPGLAAICVLELVAGFFMLHRLWGRVGDAMLTVGDHVPEFDEELSATASVPAYRSWRAGKRMLGRAVRASAALLDASRGIDHAVIAARMARRILLAIVLGTAVTFGLVEPFSVLRLGALLLAAGVAVDDVFQLAALTGTRRARQWRLAAAIEILPRASPPPPATSLGVFKTLTLANVAVAYYGAEPVLRDVDLTIARGEIIALTGPGGSGKTTLLRLILGLLQPRHGHMLFNGMELTPAVLAEFRHRVAAVWQDEELPASTIRAAILAGRPLPRQQAEEAGRVAGLAERVAALPMGMQTMIVPGAFPSGLIQQVLLARALAGQPELLVLDDVLSALGPERQKTLLQEWRRRGTTVVLTTHAPELLAAADRIVRFAAGRLSA